MKRWKAILFVAAGGLPICAAVFFSAANVPGISGPSGALAQTDDGQAATNDATSELRPLANGPGPFQQRRLLLDYLRWQSMGPQDRRNLQHREEDEWRQFLEFMKVNSPNRSQLLLRQNLRPGAPIRVRLLQRWQNMELQRNNKDLYNVLLQEFKEEDVVVGLAAQLRVARQTADSDDRIADIRQQIEETAGKLVELNLQQRRIRIDIARKLLDQEEANLEQDTTNRVSLADQRAQQLLNEANRGFPSTRPAAQ
jgi:hypothetical protein